LALPIDFSVEFEEPAQMYQTCLPQIFRHINSVTDVESEILALANYTRPRVTDNWETVHIETATGVYDHEKEILQKAGFSTVITAEDLAENWSLGEFDSPMGYYDERGLEFLWKYVDNTIARNPRNRMYLGWMSTTTHMPFLISPEWPGRESYVKDDGYWDSVDSWLNAMRWTDDKVKEIILGFRERGLEDETLFLMYSYHSSYVNNSHGDHGFPFAGQWATPIENPHNEAYRIPLMIYNPQIRNPERKKVEGNFYSLSIPTTILDLMIYTNSFVQSAQQDLALRFARNYEFAQSLLRPVKETIRFFFVHPGGTQWVLDNSRNLRCKFNLYDNHVYLVDYISDPLELDRMDSWNGVEGLISNGAEEKFGVGTAAFLREAFERQEYMRLEIRKRYGLQD
jgi:phosphoglycerol transferase MdoB-like AlkP superfamily enzyme